MCVGECGCRLLAGTILHLHRGLRHGRHAAPHDLRLLDFGALGGLGVKAESGAEKEIVLPVDVDTVDPLSIQSNSTTPQLL